MASHATGDGKIPPRDAAQRGLKRVHCIERRAPDRWDGEVVVDDLVHTEHPLSPDEDSL